MKKVRKAQTEEEKAQQKIRILITEIEKHYKLYWNSKTQKYRTKNYIEYYGEDFLTQEEKEVVKLIDELNLLIKKYPHLKERRAELG